MKDALNTLGYIYKNKADDYASVAILCDEDLTENIIKSLSVMCAIDDIELNISYIDFDKADYTEEYGISLVIENGQLSFGVEKALAKGDSYKLFDMDYVYIQEESNDKLIDKHLAYECDMDVFKIDWNCK